jgi:hypothetical protein
MSNVQGVSGGSYIPCTNVFVPATAQSPVLPDPPADTTKCDDAITMLLVLLSKKNQQDSKSGVEKVDTAKTEREEKLEEAQAAYKKMKEAENDPFAWLNNVFKAVVAVASAIATVATGGAASPALTASAMAFGSVAKETQCFGDLSNVIGAGADLLSGVGAGNLALVAGDGTSLAGTIGAKTGAFGPDVALGFSITGQCLGMFANFAPPAGASDPVWSTAAMEAKAAGIAGTTGYGIDRVVRDGEASHDAIEMKETRMAMARIDRLINALIDGVKEAHNSHNKAVSAAEGAVQIKNATALVAAGVRG